MGESSGAVETHRRFAAMLPAYHGGGVTIGMKIALYGVESKNEK